jgi:DNA-binding HxlR family transcriptional regulator
METDEVSDVPRWNMFHPACPTRQVLTRIGDTWTLLVVGALADEEALRYSELRRRVEGVSPKMLTQTLRALERDGMVTRTVYPTVPVTVEYRLTALGHDLGATVEVLRRWAYGHMEDIQNARTRYDTAGSSPG